MSDVDKLLYSASCDHSLVGHLDGCENGAYVINHKEMVRLKALIKREGVNELLALHKQDRAKVNSQCDSLINMSTVDKYLRSVR